MSDPILLARCEQIECFLLPARANRHRLITARGDTQRGVLQKVFKIAADSGLLLLNCELACEKLRSAAPTAANAVDPSKAQRFTLHSRRFTLHPADSSQPYGTYKLA